MNTKNKPIIYPFQIEMKVVNQKMIQGPNGQLWHPSQERYAKLQYATATLCRDCLTENAQYKDKYCLSCQHKRDMEKYLSLTATTSEFPVSLHGDRFFFDYDDLADYLLENDFPPEELMLYGCTQDAFYQLDSDYWNDQQTEDGELPKALEELIEEFNEKLNNIHGYWYPDMKTRFVMPS